MHGFHKHHRSRTYFKLIEKHDTANLGTEILYHVPQVHAPHLITICQFFVSFHGLFQPRTWSQSIYSWTVLHFCGHVKCWLDLYWQPNCTCWTPAWSSLFSTFSLPGKVGHWYRLEQSNSPWPTSLGHSLHCLSLYWENKYSPVNNSSLGSFIYCVIIFNKNDCIEHLSLERS